MRARLPLEKGSSYQKQGLFSIALKSDREAARSEGAADGI
jgi:hypothetical protein